MPRYGQILRQWRILLALSDREWFNLLEIRDSIPGRRLHKRTILRDMETLTRVFPIERRTFDGYYQWRLRQRIGRWLDERPTGLRSEKRHA